MERPRLQHCADLPHRVPDVAVQTAIEPRLAAPVVEVEHPAHGRRLPRAVRAEEAGHYARSNFERQVVDRDLVAVPLRQPARGNHVTPELVLSRLLGRSSRHGTERKAWSHESSDDARDSSGSAQRPLDLMLRLMLILGLAGSAAGT